MDGASEMNRPSEEPAVTPPGSLRRRLRPRENAATLLRGARACLALLAAAALLALAAPAQAQTEIWTATLTPGDLQLSILGCGNHIDSARCSSTTVLSEDSFNYDSTDYTITMLFVRSGGNFELTVDADITTATAALTLVVGSTSLVLADADTITTRKRIWNSSGVSLTIGTDIAVKLTTTAPVTNIAPTSGEQLVDADEDTDYTFTADDFGFADRNAGDSLASVKIETLPASGTGTLTLSGTAIGSGDLPKTVPEAEIDDLKYSPPANLYGPAFASFTFKVNDGTVDSDNAYTMTIDVKGKDDPATGKPEITGTAQVGQALTATVGTIADLDGLPDPLFSAALTTIQWIQVDGANETDISGATSETYTLATNDEGKKIKVKVWFEDDDGTAEGPLTSDAYPSSGTVTAAFSTSSVLVSNVGQTDSLVARLAQRDYAQSFTTGANPTGYTLTSIELRLLIPSASVTATPTVKLFSGSANGTEVSTFAGPAMLDADTTTNYTFTPPSTVDLLGSSTYWVVAEGIVAWRFTDSTSEDATSAPGWLITDGYQTRPATSNGGIFTAGSRSSLLQLRVNGATVAPAPNTAPTAANNTVTTDEDMAYTFEADDFGFADTDTGAALVSVKIVTLPAAGTLALDGTAVMALNQVVTKAQIDGNMLTFTPVTGASGTGYATFTFTVNDGTDDSASAYTMTIDVTAAGGNTAPTAANNTVTTGVGTAYTFTADDFGFRDADAGDTLASVTIVTPPAPGTLALAGTAVALNDVVTTAQIDGDMLIFTPVAGASGDPYTTFTFKVNDGTDDSASAYTMTIDVTVAPPPPPPPPPNTPPVVAIPPVDQEATTGDLFTYVIPADAFTDADGDPLTYTAALSDGGRLPSWLTFDPATRTFTGTPGPGDGGTVRVTVMVSDGTATVSDEFVLMVTVRNTAPVVANPLADQEVMIDVPFTYVVPADAFTDADGDPLAYTAATRDGGLLPGWLTFDPATRTFTGTPASSDSGPVFVTVTASDGTATVSDEFALRVLMVAPSTLRAWTSRFGRTVATHVTDAVGERLRASPEQDSQVTVGGYRLPLGRQAAGGADPETTTDSETTKSETTTEPKTATDRLASLLTGLVGQALGLGPAHPQGGGTDPWAEQPAADPRLGQSQIHHLPTVRLRDVLLGSSFRLNLGDDAAAPGHLRLTAWGRVAGTQFSGRDGALTLDGDVLTGTVGVDSAWDRWLAGVAVSHSLGGGSFTGDGDGDLDSSTLTSIHPYLRYAVNERVDVWSVLGYGWGDMTLEPGTGGTLETDTTLLMGSFGGRGILLPAPDNAGFQLATRMDAMLTRTTSGAVAGLAETEADAHRLRLVLEGTRPVLWPEGQSVTPAVELGVRHDWGDAETGFGLELGGRVQYADPNLGLTIEAAVRGLLTHEDSDYKEWGASGTIRIAPDPNGQGLSLTLSPTWGASSSGIESLWSRQTTAGLAPQGTRQSPTARLNAEIGYGLPAPLGPGLLTPYAGTVLTDGQAHSYRLGTRWTSVSGLTLNVEGTRQDQAGQQPPTQGLQFQATWGF